MLHHNYQIIPDSSSWFSAVYAAAIVHRNQYSYLYQQNKSSDSKVKFTQASIIAKRFLKLPNLHKKESITFQKIGSQGFWQIGNL